MVVGKEIKQGPQRIYLCNFFFEEFLSMVFALVQFRPRIEYKVFIYRYKSDINLVLNRNAKNVIHRN